MTSAFGRTVHQSTDSQHAASRTAPSTSVGWCMPRYIREMATPAGITTAGTRKSQRHQRSIRPIAISAIAVHRQMVAAMCPDGNDEVGSVPSRCSAAGRGRPTADALARNRVSSPNMASTRNSTGRHCRHTASAIGQKTSEIARIAWVSPALLQYQLSLSSRGVRNVCSQRGKASSKPGEWWVTRYPRK